MQISRHWRMNAKRYRLEGVRYEDGKQSLLNRPQPLDENTFYGDQGEADLSERVELPQRLAS